MAAYENVRVVADCPECLSETNAHGVWKDCPKCHGSGAMPVPQSEWAAALATVEGVEAIELADRPDGVFRQAVVLPASASTREDGQR